MMVAKPSTEGVAEIIENSRLVVMTIWGETKSLLLGRDRFVKISNIT
jgi:hypothetical protein